MSVVYERNFMDTTYSSITHDETTTGDADPTGFQVDAGVGVQDLVGSYNTETLMGPDAADHLDLHSPAVTQTLPSDHMSMTGPQPPASSPNAASPPKLDVSPSPAPPSRAKIKVKPERDATRNIDGKFQCTWEGCTEEVKTFSRRCEYNKHMDKHDRPYKCMHEGCEKLPGFTYSGGLLRHEREVHNLYGGPKNPLHCPHENCKRHTGKGFSRQENLNEHLRRVHTQSTGSDAGVAPSAAADSDGDGDKASAGHKRKRSTYDDVGTDLADEVRKLRDENKELRQQLEAQTNQTVAMMQQIQRLEQTIAAVNGRVGVPTADMTL